jgi:hypothetical protein
MPDDDLNPGIFGFSDPEPEARKAPPIQHDKYATSEPEPEPQPRRRKRRREPVEARTDEEPPKKPRRDLATEPPPDPALAVPWWYWTVVLTVLGFVGLVITVVFVGIRGGAAASAIALVGAGVGVVIETIAVAALLAGIGVIFGIDYGPVKEAIIKMFGCVAFVNGFTLALGLFCYYCFGVLGILMAMSTVTLVTFAVFQAQFRLSMFEGLVTVFAIQGCAWIMACGLGFAYMNTIR